MNFTFTASLCAFSLATRKKPWAHIDSDVWVKCSVCQMNSDSMFITLLHTALHTHAVFKINKQPSFNLPLSWTKIDLTLQIHRLLGRNHTSLQSSLVGFLTLIIKYHRILQWKQNKTYHSIYRDEIGIHGDDSELDFKEKKENIALINSQNITHREQ